MAELQFPSPRQDRAAARQAAGPARARLSPLAVAMMVSLATHLCLAAALFGRSAEPPAPSPIIAVEIVAGPPGQDARKRSRSIAAAPGASAKPTPTDPKAIPDPKANPEPEATRETKPAETRQVASATERTPAEKPPAEKPPAAASDRPTAEGTEPPPPKKPLPPKVATRIAPDEIPPAAGTPTDKPTTPQPKVAKPPVPMDDAPPVPAPDARDAVTLPKTAPPAPARIDRSDTPKTDREAPPSTALLATRPKVKPTPPKAVRERLRAEQRRARERAERQRQARRQAARKAAARKPTTTKRQTASAPAGAYVPPRPGRGSGRNRPPVYPRRAQREGWQGRVLLFVQVAASGQVAAVRVQRSSGHGILDRAALRAVRGWRFRPARRGGSAVAGTVVVPVRFRLTN